jgi:hypothetical protein
MKACTGSGYRLYASLIVSRRVVVCLTLRENAFIPVDGKYIGPYGRSRNGGIQKHFDCYIGIESRPLIRGHIVVLAEG